MTQYEWDQKWWEVFRNSRLRDPAADLLAMHEATTKYMNEKYGYRPPAVKVAGPPWWAKLGAIALGVPMGWLTSFWGFMNGKKTIAGAVITIVAYLVAGVPLVAALCTTTVCAATVAKVGGIGLTIVGLLHKLYKYIYGEEHP